MTPLRQKLIDELDLRGLSPLTKNQYVKAVERLAQHYKASPDTFDDDRLKAWLLHLIRERGLQINTVNVHVAALRFFYETVLGRPFCAVAASLPRMKRAVKRPQVYSQAELERLFGPRRE